jgi:Spy/CpxP family protein refolding chaperone
MMMDDMMMDDMGRMGGTSAGSGTAPGGGMKMGGAPAGAATRSQKAPRSISSLPGMPGASHLYHIGASGFFLDQPQLTLTAQQQSALNKIKERALLGRAEADRRIEKAEQELWTLTGAGQPDAARIRAKAREIEQLRTDQRLAFIQAVGEATKVLTPAQQAKLTGAGSASK